MNQGLGDQPVYEDGSGVEVDTQIIAPRVLVPGSHLAAAHSDHAVVGYTNIRETR